MNLGLKNLASLASIGTFITAQALNITTIFDMLAPFFIRVLHTGNAAYIGPADILPSNIDIKEPFNPDLSPKYSIIIFLGTQASINEVSKNITGIIVSISFI